MAFIYDGLRLSAPYLPTGYFSSIRRKWSDIAASYGEQICYSAWSKIYFLALKKKGCQRAWGLAGLLVHLLRRHLSPLHGLPG